MDESKIKPLSCDDSPDKATMLAYATPAPVAGSPVAAGVWTTIAGLALIFLGGCFLIGVMASSNMPTNAQFVLVLYALAFLCFATAGYLLFMGIRKLLLVGR